MTQAAADPANFKDEAVGRILGGFNVASPQAIRAHLVEREPVPLDAKIKPTAEQTKAADDHARPARVPQVGSP